jgi:ATP-binding cassette, subfamily B, bacterial MsbA
MSFAQMQYPRRIIKTFIQATDWWQDNRLVIREVKHFRKIVFFAFLFPLFAAIFEGFGIGFLLTFMQNMVSDGEPIRTGIEWFDISILGVTTSKLSRLCRASALILLSTWMRAYFNYLTAVYMDLTKIQLVDNLYKRIFEQIQSLSLGFFGKVRSGDLINILTAEVGQLQHSIGILGYLLVRSLTLFVYVFMAVTISWQLSLLSGFLFSLVAVGLSTLNKRVKSASFPVSEARSDFTGVATELIGGIRTIQAYSAQDFERRRFNTAASKIAKAMTEAAYRFAAVRPIAEAVSSTILIGMIIVGMSVFVADGTLKVASLMTFLFVLFRLVPSIQEINTCVASLGSYQGSIQSIEKFLNSDGKSYIQNGISKFPGLRSAIEMRKVDFSYNPENPILQGITLSIEKGKMLALVGASGAGKTTLVDLIPRFYEPTAGDIFLDGVNIRSFDIDSVRRRIAVVSQDTFIFNTSIRNNIAYGIENIEEADILEAARLANVLEFVQSLPEGLDTGLGDRGVRLSGGQRQRLAIARALLRNPEILILDEATSALDSVSERLIQESIEKISEGRTVIAIAHRLSTIAKADKVIVLEKGEIIEQGGYQELLDQKGKLWEYHNIQYELSQKEPILNS